MSTLCANPTTVPHEDLVYAPERLPAGQDDLGLWHGLEVLGLHEEDRRG